MGTLLNPSFVSIFMMYGPLFTRPKSTAGTPGFNVNWVIIFPKEKRISTGYVPFIVPFISMLNFPLFRVGLTKNDVGSFTSSALIPSFNLF